LCGLKFLARRIEFSANLLCLAELLLLGLPTSCEIRRLRLQFDQLVLELLEAIGGRFVRFLLQRLALDLELHDAAVELIELFRF